MKWFKTPWSIRSALRREERDWARSNKIRRRYRLALIERELLFAGEHPLRFVLSLALLQGLLLCLADRVPADWLVPLWGGWSTEEHLAYFSTVWGIQATLVALVYPIVIAFVAVFLQRRPTAESFISVYLLDSAGLAAGLSSLALVLMMSIQYLLQSTRGVDVLAAWTALNTCWLILNAALTTFFLYRTVEFLLPEVQRRVISRYLVNVALPRDVARLNGFQVLAASMHGLPVHLYGEKEPPEGPRLLLGTSMLRGGTTEVSARVSSPSILWDLKLWLVRLVVWSWSRRAHAYRVPEENSRTARPKQWPLLVLPMKPGAAFKDALVLAQVHDGPSLKNWERLVLRMATKVIKESDQRQGVVVDSVLAEMSREARQAAASGDNDRFEEAYSWLVAIHRLLLGASITRDVDGNVSSWALLPDITFFFNRSLHEKWVESYRGVFEVAVDVFAVHPYPLRRLCGLLNRLRGEELDNSPREIREHILQFQPVLMYLLGRWWERRIGEQGSRSLGPNTSELLLPPLRGQYDEVLSQFVGGWENGRPDLPSRHLGTEAWNWKEAQSLSESSVLHLEETARMLLSAAYRGDKAAAEWFADVLTKWWDKYGDGVEPYMVYSKAEFITLDYLGLEWEAVSDEFGFSTDQMPGVREGQVELQQSVYRTALRNFWTDIRLLVVELLVDWASDLGEEDCGRSLSLYIATGLLAGRQWRDGGSVADSFERLSAADYFVAKVRQFAASGEWRGGYVGRLDSFVERTKNLERPSMIGSRVYVFGGADDVRSLRKSQLYVWAALTSGTWSVPRVIGWQVNKWLRTQYGSIDVLLRQLDSWLNQLSELSEPVHHVVKHLRATARPMAAPDGSWKTLADSLRSVKESIESVRAEALAAEPIDQDRLKEISLAASSTGFGKSTAEFPVHLFDIQSTPDDLEPYSLRYKKVGKGELTRVEMDQRAINEAETYARTLAENVAWVVLSDVLRLAEVETQTVANAESYWLALQQASADISSRGDAAILILENPTLPRWIWDWQHEGYESKYPRPDGLRVQRREGQGRGYLCHFNEIAVYFAPLPPGESLLLPRGSLKRLEFTEFFKDCFVKSDATPRPDASTLVDLSLTFARKVHVQDLRVLRLQYKVE